MAVAVVAMTDYGSGFELDQNLDLVINPAGDLSTVDGVDELKKDLSFRLIKAFGGQTAGYLSHDTRHSIQKTAEGVLLSDPRVEGVTRIDVETAPGEDSVTITVEARTADGPFEFVETV